MSGLTLGEEAPGKPGKTISKAKVLPDLVRVYKGHTREVNRVWFIPGTNNILSTSIKETIIWDRESGKELHRINMGVLSAVSPDGKTVAVTMNGGLGFFDTSTGKLLREVKPNPKGRWRDLRYSPNGKIVATGDAVGQVSIYETATAKLFKQLPKRDGVVLSVGFSPDSKYLLSATNKNNLEIWDAQNGKFVRNLPGNKGPVFRMVFTPDGQYLLTGGYDKDVIIRDFSTGREVGRLKGHQAVIRDICIAPDGLHALSASDDQLAIYWDLESGNPLKVFKGHKNGLRACDISSDGQFALTGSGGTRSSGKYSIGNDLTMRLWRLPKIETPKNPKEKIVFSPIPDGPVGEVKRMKNLNDPIMSIDYSPDGQMLATGDINKLIRLWDVASGEETGRLNGHTDRVGVLSFSPDGKKLVSGSKDKTIRIWDLKTKKELSRYTIRTSDVLSIRYFPDSRRIAFGCWGYCGIWDPEKNSVIELKGTKQTGVAITVSPDGKYVATGGDKAFIRLWNAKDGSLVREFTGHVNTVRGLEFTAKGNQLISGSQDGVLRLWDLKTGKIVRVFEGHTGRVFCVKLIPNSDRVVSTGDSNDQSIRIWDIKTGNEIWKQSHVEGFTRSIALSPDGRYLATGNSAKYANIIRIPSPNDVSAREEYEMARKQLAQAHEGIRVAVLSFDASSLQPQFSKLGLAISEMTIANLSGLEGITCVERNRVQAFLKEMKLSKEGLISAETAVKAGQSLTVDYLLTGRLSQEGKKFKLEVVLMQPGEKSPVAKWNISSEQNQIMKFPPEVAQKVLASLELKDAKQKLAPKVNTGNETNVAIISFRDLSSDSGYESMQTGFAEYLQTTLSIFPQVKLVERTELERILKEQSLTLSGLVDPTTTLQVSRLLGASRYIYGDYFVQDKQLTLIVKLADTQTGSLLASEMVEGTTDKFAELMEKVSLNLINSLAKSPPRDSAKLIRLAIPVRKLEVAVYLSRARENARLGKMKEAIQDLDRGLLLEPNNIEIRQGKIRALYKNRESIEEMIQLSQETLKLKFTASQVLIKNDIYIYLLAALKYTGKHDERIQVARAWAREFPTDAFRDAARMKQASSLVSLGQIRAALDLYESSLFQAQLSGDDARYGDSLQNYYYFYHNVLLHSWEFRNDTELAAQTAVQITDAIRELIKAGKRIQSSDREKWKSWGITILNGNLKIVVYNKEENEWESYLSDAELYGIYQDALEVFESEKHIARKAYYVVGNLLVKMERWEEAVKAFQKVIDTGWQWSRVPPFHSNSPGWIDGLVYCQYQIGNILAEHLNEPDQARATLQKLVDLYGLENIMGPQTVAALHKLKAEPIYQGRYALVWGESGEVMYSWEKLLKPHGYKVHSMQLSHLSAAGLLAYDLVILTRTRNHIWTPSEMLALQQYVAAGGSLLIVVSPVYNPATVGNHQSLLSLFDLGLQNEDKSRSFSTEIDQTHSITQGIPAVSVRYAVGIQVSKQAKALIKTECGPVLVSRQYERGRLIVSSFAQWLFPDPTVLGNNWKVQLEQFYRGNREDIPKLPLETFGGTNAKLLNQTIVWLSFDKPAQIKNFRKLIQPAIITQQRYEAQSLPFEEVKAAYEKSLTAMHGTDRELGLWLAGISQLRLQYFPIEKNTLTSPAYGFQNANGPPVPDSIFFKQIIKEYPDNHRTDLAKWQLAESLIRGQSAREHQSYSLHIQDDSVVQKVLGIYKSIPEDPHHPAWVWAQLRSGELHLTRKDAKQSLPYFLAVSEKCPSSPEQVRSLFNLGRCYTSLKQKEKAKQTYQKILASPNYEWSRWGFEYWEPLSINRGSSHFYAKSLLNVLLNQDK